MNLDAPIFFAENRVWRCYVGGALLGRFRGTTPEEDSHRPEDWLASTVRAINGEHSQGPEEGLARALKADGSPGPLLTALLREHADTLLGEDHTSRYGVNIGILCKYLDSAVRLPVQCHPDKALAKEYYNSIYGKAESWHILDTRVIKGQPPYLLMGFKEGFTREKFAAAVLAHDPALLVGMLHKVPVAPGETYFIPGRMPHAIGPGVLILETQEPSDCVVRAEPFCGDTPLSDRDRWGPLTPEQALRVFEPRGSSEKALLDRVRAKGDRVSADEGGEVVELIGRAHTEAFAVRRVTVTGKLKVALPRSFGIAVVTGGSGTVRWSGGKRDIRRGDYFLQPATVEQMEYTAAGPMSLVLCLPPAP